MSEQRLNEDNFKDSVKDGFKDGCSIGVYVRESRDEQGENYETIETQRDLLLHFAEEKLKGNVHAIYIDDNVSGSGFDRAGIRQLKHDVQYGSVNLLLLKDLSRLGRNNAQTLLFLDYLEEYGVRVLTFDGRYDSNKDNDTVGIETWANERYIRDISRKIRTNMHFKIQRGEYLGTAPYGYVKSPKVKNRLCIDEPKAAVVREMFRLYVEGTCSSEIARHLNAKGYAAPSGREGAKWHPATVGRMLSNRVYIGDTVQGVSEKLSFKSKKTRRLPEAKWVITENTHKAIISRELYEKADAIKRLNSRKTGGHRGNIHPFRGLLYCGGCGSLMLARKRQGRPMSYICGAYAKSGRLCCSSHHVREDELMSLVKNRLQEILNDRNIVKKTSELLDKSCRESCIVSGVSGLRAELAEKKRQQDLLYKDRLEGNISEELFFRTNCTIEKVISDIENRIKEFVSESRLEPDKLIDCIRGDISAVIRENRLIKMLIKRILIYEGEDVSDKLDNIPDEGIIIVEMNYKK